MPPSSPQFTPAQVLAAGRRAETEGKPDLAEHFFRHVVEHYGATPEAASARDGLIRLGEKRANGPLAPSSATPVSQPPPMPAPQAKAGPAAATRGAKDEPARPDTALRGNAASGDESAGEERPQVVTGSGLMPPEPRDVGAAGRRRRYRIGRTMAGLAGLVGWLMVLAGLALVPLAWTSKATEWLPVLASPAGLAATAGWAAVQSFGGLILVLLAQVARAVFDIAEQGGGSGASES